MKTPETSSLFTPWTHPETGVVSYVLTERVAPVQQSFYYTHPSFSDDGRYLWLGCGFPPAGGRHAQQVLGVVDFEEDRLHVYHDTQWPSSRPLVDPKTAEVYWGNHLDIWKRGPRPEDRPQLVNSFPKELACGTLQKLATHPTFSADGRSLNLDAKFIQRDGSIVSFLGELPLEGAPFKLWEKIEGVTYNHALFSPTDPDLQLFAHEFWQDAELRGEAFDGSRTYHRIWLLRRGEEARPLLKEPITHSGHEWWDADGRHIYYLHYGHGIKRVDIASGEERLVWPGELSHGHSDQSGRYLVADKMDNPGRPNCNVLFFDTQTGAETEIVSAPPLPSDATQCVHLHPHPQFCLQDRYICYTSIVHGRVDIALTPTDALRGE